MTENVEISIKSVHYDVAGEGQSETIENVYKGKYFYRNDKHFCVYDEFLDDENKPTRNQIKICQGHAEVLKKGQILTRLEFDIHNRSFNRYDTPYGPIDLSIDTDRIVILEEEERLYIEMEYDMYIGEDKNSHCIMSFDIKSDNNI